jgi:hypothetical protein
MAYERDRYEHEFRREMEFRLRDQEERLRRELVTRLTVQPPPMWVSPGLSEVEISVAVAKVINEPIPPNRSAVVLL